MIRLKIAVPFGLRLQLDKREKLRVLRAAGLQVAQETRKLLRKNSPSGRNHWSVNGKYRASAPGQAPARRTGALAASIVVRNFPSGGGVAIRSKRFYSTFLEAGATVKGRKGARISGQTVYIKGRKFVRRRQRARSGTIDPRPFLSAALTAAGQKDLATRVKNALQANIKLAKAP